MAIAGVPQRRWTSCDWDVCRDRVGAGASDAEIAAELGVTVHQLRDFLRRVGIRRDREADPALPPDRVRQLHAAGLTDVRIAAILGCSRFRVARVRKKLGLPTQPDCFRRTAGAGGGTA